MESKLRGPRGKYKIEKKPRKPYNMSNRPIKIYECNNNSYSLKYYEQHIKTTPNPRATDYVKIHVYINGLLKEVKKKEYANVIKSIIPTELANGYDIALKEVCNKFIDKFNFNSDLSIYELLL